MLYTLQDARLRTSSSGASGCTQCCTHTLAVRFNCQNSGNSNQLNGSKFAGSRTPAIKGHPLFQVLVLGLKLQWMPHSNGQHLFPFINGFTTYYKCKYVLINHDVHEMYSFSPRGPSKCGRGRWPFRANARMHFTTPVHSVQSKTTCRPYQLKAIMGPSWVLGVHDGPLITQTKE